MFDEVTEAYVRYDGETLSDHNAVIISLESHVVRRPNNNIVTHTPHIVWRKDSSEQLSQYQSLLEERLRTFTLNENCYLCNNYM